MTMWVLIIILAVSAIWTAAVMINRRAVRRSDGSGDPTQGIIVFVEPVRWLFIIWGFNALCHGFRRAGLRHAVYLFQWSRAAGSLLVLPDLMRRSRLNAKAERLARRIHEIARQYPHASIHVIGYSTGVYIAFEAIKLLPQEVVLSRLIAIHGTVSPAYDLKPIIERVQVINIHSRMDCIINGLGPLLFGTNDRRHDLACGMVGLRTLDPRLRQRHWTWSDVRQGYFGDHFSVMSRRWVRQCLVPVITA